MAGGMTMQDSYKPTAHFDAGKFVIALFETLLGLVGALTLILYFVTGSLSAAGQKADAGLAAIGVLLASVTGNP
jgi:hypothetical protein